MWMLRNLKKYGATAEQLKLVYIQQIRSISEYCCPVWNAGLKKKEIRAIERIQRTACAIITGNFKYSENLNYLQIESLENRRTQLCLKFALKMYKSDKFSHYFKESDSVVNTRSVKMPLKEVKYRRKRFLNSPLPYLTNLLNNHLQNVH